MNGEIKAGLKANLKNAEAALKEAQELVDKTRRAGMSIEDAQTRVNELRQRIVKARIAFGV